MIKNFDILRHICLLLIFVSRKLMSKFPDVAQRSSYVYSVVNVR
uniref:Uncharacterized protein n=1 Tax=Dulem virus 31 TaxID=3145749 RepID=A0AAU8AT57_9VIRU